LKLFLVTVSISNNLELGKLP